MNPRKTKARIAGRGGEDAPVYAGGMGISSRLALWLGTHLVVLALAYGLTRAGDGGFSGAGADGDGARNEVNRKRLADLAEERENAGLLSEFMKAHVVEVDGEGDDGAQIGEVLSPELRLRNFTASEQNVDRPAQDVLNDFVRIELDRFFAESRDWRFEFRHGKVSLEEIVAAAKAAMPDIPAEGQEALTVSLFRELIEEDRERAMPLLDDLPEDRRRDALFHSTWLAVVNVQPDHFLEFCRSLPEPVEDWEKDLRTKGWNWKARGFLLRFGDDYVEWVKEMPEGLDKETAMNSLIWATREENPAEARKLSEELYPKASE